MGEDDLPPMPGISKRKDLSDDESLPPAPFKIAKNRKKNNNNNSSSGEKPNFFDFDSLIKAQTLEASKPSLTEELNASSDSNSNSNSDGRLDSFHESILKRMAVKTESSLKFPPQGYDLFYNNNNVDDRFHSIVDEEAAMKDPLFSRLSVAFGASFGGLNCCLGVPSFSNPIDSLFKDFAKEGKFHQ